MKKRTLVIGVFDHADAVVDAIHELRRSSFSDDQLGFVVRYGTDNQGINALASEIISDLLGTGNGLLLPTAEIGVAAEHSQSALILEGKPQHTADKDQAKIIIGSVIGGILGTVAILLLPGIGPIVVGGALAATLDANGMTPNFLSVGIPEYKTQYYEQNFQAGNIILTIKAAELQQEAQDILRYNRAYSIELF